MQGFRYLRKVATLALNVELCIGCGRCMDVCPHNVFVFEGGRAHLADCDACMECGACARNCPAGAISVDAGVGCAAGIMSEWRHERNLGRKKSGCC